jgi:hypothetical protein
LTFKVYYINVINKKTYIIMAKNKWSWLTKIAPTKEELENFPQEWFDKNWDWQKWEEDWLWPVVSEK